MDNRFRPIYNNAVFPDTPIEEIRRELQWYKDNGYGGFAVNGAAKTKLKDVGEWLPGYLRSVRRYCDEAKRQHLDMWIFDEWGYPSGCACGLVLTPATRPKKLSKAVDVTLEDGECLDMPAPARLLCVGAIPVDRFGPYHPAGRAALCPVREGRIRVRAEGKTRVVGVTWEPHSFVTHVMKDYVEGDPTIGTTDILDRACVRKFLDNMHERYVPVIGDEFGRTVKGFFYDEPEICWEFPWTESLGGRFEARHGYDMLTILPELVAYSAAECGVTGGGDAYARLRAQFADYTDAWTSLLSESFYGQIENWCHEHRLLSVGHQDLDNHAETLLTVSGDFWRNSARNDRPGIDVIWDNIAPDRFDDFPRFAGSVKRALGKDGAMSETFAEMGDCMPPDVMRYVMAHQIVRGIDQFFLYTTHNSRPQADPNVGVFTRALMDRAAFAAARLSEGRPGAKVALLVPLQAIAFERSHLNPHAINGTPLPWERVDRLAEALCYAPIDFDYAWEEGLTDLRARGFEHLVLPGVPLSDAALEGARAFAEAGGTVWSAYSVTPGFPAARHMASPRQLAAALPRPFVRATSDGVSLTVRETADGPLAALLNETEAPARVTLTAPALRIEPDTGAERPDGPGLTLAPRELALLRFAPDAAAPQRGEGIALTDWTLNGRPIDRLAPWPALGLSGYTGWAAYETAFDWPGGAAELSLGEVGFAARVSVDGGEPVDAPFSPWTVDLDPGAGRHTLQVDVLNSLASRAFAENPAHRWGFEQAYLRCGLLGPVTLRRR